MPECLIRSASYDDIPALTEIWRECFGDSDEYIDLFMRRRFNASHTVVAVTDNRLVGATCMLPCAQVDCRDAYYSYSGGVLPQYRGRGIFNLVFSEIMRRTKLDGRDGVGVPLSALTTYYAKFALTGRFARVERCWSLVNHNESQTVRRSALTAFECKTMRDSYFTSRGSIVWDLEAVDYALDENRLCGGICDKIEVNDSDKVWYIIGKLNESVFEIDETTLSYPMLDRLSGQLMLLYGADRITAKLRASDELINMRQEYAMTTCIDVAPDAWIGLTMI